MALTLEQPAWEGTYYSAPLWGSQVMLTLRSANHAFRSSKGLQQEALATTACRPNPDSHWVLFKKGKKVLSKRMNAAKFLRLHSIFDCLWTTTQSWVVGAEMYGLQSLPIWLTVYRKSLPISGTGDLVLKLHKCVVLINSFLCIKKTHKNHLPVLLSPLKKTAIKLAILCKCVSWLISTVIQKFYAFHTPNRHFIQPFPKVCASYNHA